MGGLQHAVKLLEGTDRAWADGPTRQSPLEGISVPIANEIQVMEVEAFCGVHDMIHAAILSHGSQASLREIYRACEIRGRIAYKRSGGSRLITQNEHWKSQIRHALYTSDRFIRASEGADCWTVSKNYVKLIPQTTTVLVRTSDEGRAVIDQGPLARGGASRGGARRLTRSKHALDDSLPVSPRCKRTRMTRAASGFDPGSAADNEEMHTGHGDASPDLSDSMASGAGHHHLHARTSAEDCRAGPSGFQGSAQGMEGIDESSQNNHLVPRASRTPSTAPRTRRLMTPSMQHDKETVLAHSSAVAALGSAPEALAPGSGDALRPGSAGRGRWGQRLTLSLQRNPHWGRSSQTLEELPTEKPLEGSNSPVGAASMRRARSAEAESPPTTQLYALRSRVAAAPSQRSPPGFGASPDPEAAAAADHAASTTMGPIKSRLKAAAKAAAAAEAASAARAAHEEACSTYTHDEVVTAVESQAHTSAEPRNLRRKSAISGDGNEVGRAAALPEEAPPPGRPRSASRANTPSLDTFDPARKRGGKRVPVKLIEQVQQRHAATQITGGSSAHLIPQTPSMTARHLHPGLASYSSTPGATPLLTPPRTFMSSLQGAASSVAANNKGAEMLLAYDEELPPEDCTEGADESDDGGARRMLRSHAAAAAAAAGTGGNGAGFKRAAIQVLQSTSEAMTAKQLAQAALDQGLISSSNKNAMPESLMASSLSSDIKQKERRSAFTKPEEGKFGLRSWHE